MLQFHQQVRLLPFLIIKFKYYGDKFNKSIDFVYG